METLILSPHCDDIPLSIGATLLKDHLIFPPHVVVVFSQSRYTRIERGTGQLERVSAIRQSEERQAANLANYRVTFLPYGEPFVRPGYLTAEDIFDTSRRFQDETLWEDVHNTLIDLLKSHTGPIIGPLGCGNHIDHRIVTSCLREFLCNSNSAIGAFYEDLHYAAAMKEEGIRSLLPETLHNEPVIPFLIRGVTVDPKLRLLSTYESQMEEEWLARVSHHWERLGNAERFWTTRIMATEIFKLYTTL